MVRVDHEVLTLAQELAEVSRLMEDDDVAATLERLVGRVVRTVPGCDHATITGRGRDGVETVVGVGESHGPELAAGPIREVLDYREPRRLDDMLADRRWPEFSAQLASMGYRSCLVLPLPTRRSPVAALTLFSHKPHQFDDSVYDVVLLLTLHAGVAFDNAQLYHDSRRLVEQLTVALGTRHVIGQAQGLLMYRFNCDGDHSFELLKGVSQHRNTKLRDVATALVTAHERNELTALLAEFGLCAP